MRLIDADALRETIKNQNWKSDTRNELTLKWIEILINESPTIDAWIYPKHDNSDRNECESEDSISEQQP